MEERIERQFNDSSTHCFQEEEFVTFMHDLKQKLKNDLFVHANYGVDCFYGSLAVPHLGDLLGITSESHIVMFGNLLLRKKYILHVTHQSPFVNSDSVVFRFNSNWKMALVRNNWSMIAKQGKGAQSAAQSLSFSSASAFTRSSRAQDHRAQVKSQRFPEPSSGQNNTPQMRADNSVNITEYNIQMDVQEHQRIDQQTMQRQRESAEFEEYFNELSDLQRDFHGRRKKNPRYSLLPTDSSLRFNPGHDTGVGVVRTRADALKIDVSATRRPSNPILPLPSLTNKSGDMNSQTSNISEPTTQNETGQPAARKLSDPSKRHTIHISASERKQLLPHFFSRLLPDSTPDSGSDSYQEYERQNDTPTKPKAETSKTAQAVPKTTTNEYTYNPKQMALKTIPAKRKYSRRGSLMIMLQGETIRQTFKTFAQHELSGENVIFWEEVEHYRMLAEREDRIQFGTGLFRLFIRESSPLSLNLPSYVTSALAASYQNGLDDTFDDAQLHAELCMADTFNRFKTTSDYETWSKTHRLNIIQESFQ